MTLKNFNNTCSYLNRELTIWINGPWISFVKLSRTLNKVFRFRRPNHLKLRDQSFWISKTTISLVTKNKKMLIRITYKISNKRKILPLCNNKQVKVLVLSHQPLFWNKKANIYSMTIKVVIKYFHKLFSVWLYLQTTCLQKIFRSKSKILQKNKEDYFNNHMFPTQYSLPF